MKTIFLDIDGVLNDHIQQPNGYCGINKECVRNLNYILMKVPNVKIVLISAWRYMLLGSMTLRGFEQMMLVCGLNCKDKFIGYTVFDEQISLRANQVKSYLANHREITNYVIIDDLDLGYTENGLKNGFYQTEGSVGLTLQTANRIIDKLNK